MKYFLICTLIFHSIQSNTIVYRKPKVQQQISPLQQQQEPIQVEIKKHCCDVLDETNNYRNRNGLYNLVGDTRLDQAALVQCNNLVKVGDLVHDTLSTTLSSRVSSVDYNWSELAENILYEKGYGNPSPDRAVDQWINSDGHALNMRGNYLNIGSAYCKSPLGRIYWVQVFGSGDSNDFYKYSKRDCDHRYQTLF